jgi:hypothetical protein
MTATVLMFVALYQTTVSPTQFYTTLILFDRFVTPINSFPWAFGEFLGCVISFLRLKGFLSQSNYNTDNNNYYYSWPSRINRV